MIISLKTFFFLFGASTVGQWAKLAQSILTSRRALFQVPGASFPTQLPATGLGKVVEDDPGCWAPSPHMRRQEEVPDSWPWPDPAVTVVLMWGMNQQMEALSLSPSLCVFPFLSNSFNSFILIKWQKLII